MTWKIKAIAGPFVGQEILVDQDKIIGRDASVDVVLQGGHISRRHAALFLQDNQLWIKDLNSSNGTLVNGNRISEQPLHVNDEIQIDVVRFLVLNTLHETLREKTTESVVLNEQGLPTTIAVPKPAPITQQQPQPIAPARAPADQPPVAPQKGIKNTLPAAVGMAILILLIILVVWHFIGQ